MSPAGRIVLRRLEPLAAEGEITSGVAIESPHTPRRRLWYRVRLPEGWRLTGASDPFVLVPLYDAMRRRLPIHVEGDLSPSLLANLEEFQRFWARWYPGRFTPVEIVPDHEREQTPGASGALTAFSGGVDSCFTAFRHAMGGAGQRNHLPLTAVMAHGFDVPLEETAEFDAAADRAQSMLATLGLPLVRVATNVRHVEHAWDDAMGAALASCLMLLQPNARVGLIGSTLPYHLATVWGSHPSTDPLLSSASLQIVHDGAGFTRPEKIAAIAQWPAALEGLRVCWRGAARDRNCGRCGKCVSTILMFRALGLPVPHCFDRDVGDLELLSPGRLDRVQKATLRMVLDEARGRGLNDRWVWAARAGYYGVLLRERLHGVLPRS